MQSLSEVFLNKSFKDSAESFVCESDYAGCTVCSWFTKNLLKDQYIFTQPKIWNLNEHLNISVFAYSIRRAALACKDISCSEALPRRQLSKLICNKGAFLRVMVSFNFDKIATIQK